MSHFDEAIVRLQKAVAEVKAEVKRLQEQVRELERNASHD